MWSRLYLPTYIMYVRAFSPRIWNAPLGVASTRPEGIDTKDTAKIAGGVPIVLGKMTHCEKNATINAPLRFTTKSVLRQRLTSNLSTSTTSSRLLNLCAPDNMCYIAALTHIFDNCKMTPKHVVSCPITRWCSAAKRRGVKCENNTQVGNWGSSRRPGDCPACR